jgi:hypothetical protein
MRCLAQCIVSVTRSRMVHCAVGIDGAVLNPIMSGNQYWPHIAYVITYARLTCAFRIEVHVTVDLDRYGQGKPRKAWPTVLKLLTRGWYRTDDCVDTVIDAMRQAGIRVPRYVIAPIDLHDWLLAAGYDHVRFTGEPHAEDRRPAGPADHRHG